MPPLLWAGAAGSAMTALVPAHGGAEVPDTTNDFVFWALPVAKLLFNLSGAAVTGSLILAGTALKPGGREYARALNFAGISAVVWMAATILTGFVDYLDKSGEPVAFTESFGHRLLFFFTDVGLGQMWLATAVIVSLIPVLCLGARHIVSAVLALVLAVAGWVPLALIGHPNYGQGHEAGILAFGLHIVSAAAWLGGLMALVVLRPVLGPERLRAVVHRYSTLALTAFLVLVFSGFLRAQVTVGAVENLRSPFGSLVALKIAAVVVLGVVGFVQRRWVLSRMGRDSSGRLPWFWWLVGLEVLVMTLASGAAVTLLRLDEPIPDDPVVNYRVLAEKMADEPLPPAPAPATFLTETLFDPLWLVLITAGIFCYAAGVRRLRRQGVHWSARRTVSWLTGLLMLLYITNGGVNQYQNFLLSAQVLAQTALTTLVPVLLVLGRPVSLALAAVRPRGDGSRGAREWLQMPGRSRAAAVLARPSVAGGLLVVSVLAFYFTPLLEWSARELLGHQWMLIHFLAFGCLFATAVLGHDDRGDHRRRPWPALLAVGVVHVLLGAWMAWGARPVSADWYAAMQRPWGIDPLTDQQLGGWYLLALGAVQVAALAAAVTRRHNAPALASGGAANSADPPTGSTSSTAHAEPLVR